MTDLTKEDLKNLEDILMHIQTAQTIANEALDDLDEARKKLTALLSKLYRY